MDISRLKEDGFVLIDYPEALRKRVRLVMKSWQRFCLLKEEEKRMLSGGDRIRDFGYMHRNDSGANADNKELFHLNERDVRDLSELSKKISDSRARMFIRSSARLIEEISPFIFAFADGVEKMYGVQNFAHAVHTSTAEWTFRFLHYFPGETLAHPHVDRGGFTMHLYETHGGGEYFDFTRTWHTWPVSEKETIIFPSMGLQYESRGELRALWHQVLGQRSTKNIHRFALVAFIDFAQAYRFDDSKRRLQDFPVGFNYEISYEDFQKLFVPRV